MSTFAGDTAVSLIRPGSLLIKATNPNKECRWWTEVLFQASTHSDETSPLDPYFHLTYRAMGPVTCEAVYALRQHSRAVGMDLITMTFTRARKPIIPISHRTFPLPHDIAAVLPIMDYFTTESFETASQRTKAHLSRLIDICDVLRRDKKSSSRIAQPRGRLLLVPGDNGGNLKVAGICIEKYPRERYISTILVREPPDQKSLCDFFKGLVYAVRELHELGLIHNNIGPESVVLKADGTVVIAELGTCTPRGEEITILRSRCPCLITIAPYFPKLATDSNDIYCIDKFWSWSCVEYPGLREGTGIGLLK
ncbi:hypothetical protein PLICRDRAFT_177335 [Plicaturopsis crispa FD-325 SS-3]|nr:hypothetical protein PLICRDRAFT_177335 [Plicaturopsis crispa FD-325 SS-3]